MQYKCQECNDTGSRDKLGTYLDCNACGTAATRRDLNDFVKSLGPTHPEDVALAIHQRALAMAPKQEAPRQWVAIKDSAWVNIVNHDHAYEGWDKDYIINHVFKLTEAKCKELNGPGAAAAFANGALPELPEPLEIYWPELHSSALGCGVEDRGLRDRYECAEYGWQDGVDKAVACVPDGIYDADQMHAYGQACAAAGPDAALTDAKHLVDITTAIMSQHGLIDHLSSGATQAFCDDLCAALFGAKGN